VAYYLQIVWQLTVVRALSTQHVWDIDW